MAVRLPPPAAAPTPTPTAGRRRKNHVLQIGLGFAAGAMFWVACFELFLEAVEDSSKLQASLTTAGSFVVMLCVHTYFDHEL